MADSCCGANVRFDGLDPGYRRVLWSVIAINALMFVVDDLRLEPGRHRAIDPDSVPRGDAQGCESASRPFGCRSFL